MTGRIDRQQSTGAPDRIAAEYREVLARTVLAAALALAAGAYLSRRRLVNHLRGSQAPRAAADGAIPPAYGLLEGCAAAWVESAVDRLVEEGYLALAAPSGPVRGGITVTETGKRLLARREALPEGVLPARPRLGAHPEREERLRALRRELARQEGRAPYGVFPNATLAELAARSPRTLAELAEVPGLGEARLRKFGRRILAVLRGPPDRKAAR